MTPEKLQSCRVGLTFGKTAGTVSFELPVSGSIKDPSTRMLQVELPVHRKGTP